MSTLVCVDGFTGPNGRSRDLGFTIPYDFPGGIQSVRVYIAHQPSSGEYIGFDEFRTRNRP